MRFPLWVIGAILSFAVSYMVMKYRQNKSREELLEPAKPLMISEHNYYLDGRLKLMLEGLGFSPLAAFELPAPVRTKILTTKRTQFLELMQQLTYMVLAYYQLPCDEITIHQTTDPNDHAAGYFCIIEDKPHIIYNKPKVECGDPELILSVIAHECAHYLLYHIKADLPESACINPINYKQEQEKYTDLAAIYCGFGQYLLSCYEERKTIVKDEFTADFFKGASYNIEIAIEKLGYLTLDQIAYAERAVGRMRTQQPVSQ